MTADPDSLRRSPLGHLADVFVEHSTEAVRLRELPFSTQINLQYDPAHPVAERIQVVTGGVRVLRLGPEEWLVLASDGAADRLLTGLHTALAEAGADGSVVDVSANRTTLELAGPAAREVLEKGCSVDLHPRAFQPGDCVQTMVSKVNVVLHQIDGLPTYHLLVRGSFAQYLTDWLLDAMAEYRPATG